MGANKNKDAKPKMIKLVAYGLLAIVMLTAAEDMGLVPAGRYLHGIPRWHMGPHLEALAEEGAARAGQKLEEAETSNLAAAAGGFTQRIVARAQAGTQTEAN